MAERVARSAIVLILAALAPTLVSTPSFATHWCSSLIGTYSPTSGTARDNILFAITLTNGQAEALELSSISVQLGWDLTVQNWGSMSLPGFSSRTNSHALFLPSTPGDYTIYISLDGRAEGDSTTENCGGSLRATFRVLAYLTPTVSVIATPSVGPSPLAVIFTAVVSGGVDPFTYSWTFGDGTSGSGRETSHTYRSAGRYTVKVVVTDGSGGPAHSDSATVVVEASFLSPGSSEFSILLGGLIGAIVGAVLFAMRRKRRRRAVFAFSQPSRLRPRTGSGGS